MSKQLSICITGVAGFIGSNLAIELVKRKYNVVGFDNLSQGSLENLASIKDHANFTFIQGDILDRKQLQKACKNCNAIFHLAAFKIPRYSDALDTLRINGIGSDNVAQIAHEVGCYLIAASTSDVYGKNPELPFHEDSNMVMGPPTVRRWSYAISKMFEEQLYFAYHERYGIDVSLVRFFGGYGPHQHLTWWGGPQSSFITKALENKAIELHGDGQQTRTFTYISDHVDGLIRILETEKAKNEVFNLGAYEEITIENLAKKIWYLVRGEDTPKLSYTPYETFGKYEDVRRRVPDISKARDLLQYEPKITLDEGLKRTIEWQINYLKKQAA